MNNTNWNRDNAISLFADTELHSMKIEPATMTLRFLGPGIGMAEYFTLVLNEVVSCDISHELFNRMGDDVVINGSRSYIDGSMRMFEILMDVKNRVACRVVFKQFNLHDGWNGVVLATAFSEQMKNQ